MFLVTAVLAGVLVTAGTYTVMTETSTPGFCALCHEIAPAVESWRTSSHASNEHGFQATCIDCHLPPPQNTLEFFYLKTKHGLKDIWAHYFHGEYDRQKMQKKVHASMDNAACLKCHANLLYIQSSRGAMRAHREVLYSEAKRRCLECHTFLVHIRRDTYSTGIQGERR